MSTPAPKPVERLTQDDLVAFAMWEYVMDDDSSVPDETYVRPLSGKHVPKNRCSVLVRSDFTLADSVSVMGFMVVDTANKQIEITPGAIITEAGYASLPNCSASRAIQEKLDWVLKDRKHLATILRRPPESFFPIRYVLTVPVAAERTVRSGFIM